MDTKTSVLNTREKGQALIEYAIFQLAFLPIVIGVIYMVVFATLLYMPARSDMATLAVEALATRAEVSATNRTIEEYTIVCEPAGNIVNCHATIPVVFGLKMKSQQSFEGEMRP